MAKGQKRTTKEIRKPKQDKKPDAKPDSPFASQVKLGASAKTAPKK